MALLTQTQIVFLSHLQDKNGTIENEELKGFLKDLLELVKKASTDIVETSLSTSKTPASLLIIIINVFI